jgi:3-oxoacyl-[acyl-carrier protein] reductase
VTVAGDITTPRARGGARRLPEPDILVNNAAARRRRFPQLVARGLDQGAGRQHADADRAHQGDVDGMIARKFGRIVNITSGSVKMPIPELGLSNGARTGLTGFVAGSRARRGAQRHHQRPAAGPFDTDRLRGNLKFNAQNSARRRRNWSRCACRPIPPSASAPSRNSAPPARSSAARTPLHHRPEPSYGRGAFPGTL